MNIGCIWQSTTHLQDDGEHVGVIDMGMRNHTVLVHINPMVIATNSRWDAKHFGWRKTKDVFITDPSHGGCIGNSRRLLKPSGAGSSSAYRIRGGPKHASTIFEPCEGHLKHEHVLHEEMLRVNAASAEAVLSRPCSLRQSAAAGNS